MPRSTTTGAPRFCSRRPPGPRPPVLVDLGHHLPNANIEQVVSRLAMVGRLGGFHFNDSKYGDDDLTTGSIKPFQLFLIFCELLRAGEGRLPALAYMIDQSHNIKDPLEDLIQSTEACLHRLRPIVARRPWPAPAGPGRQRRHARPGDSPGCVSDRRSAIDRRGPASLGGRHRPASGLSRPGVPPGQDRGAGPGFGGHRPVTDSARVLAVDLGATSVRVAAIDLEAAHPEVDVLHRYPHTPTSASDGSLRWDWDRIVSEVEVGLEKGLGERPGGLDRGRWLGS